MFVIRETRGGNYFAGYLGHRVDICCDLDKAIRFDTVAEALRALAMYQWVRNDVEIVEFVEPEPSPRWIEKRVVA